MTEKKEKIQAEVNDLFEKRISLLRELAIATNKRDSFAKHMKSLQKEMDGIDRLAQEKMDEINGKHKKEEPAAEEEKKPDLKSDLKRIKGAKKSGQDNFLVK